MANDSQNENGHLVFGEKRSDTAFKFDATQIMKEIEAAPDDSELETKKKVFYEEYADGILRFKDGEIKVNKAILSTKIQYFRKSFSEQPPTNEVFIEDYDVNTFKLFLDCLLKFQKCSVIDAISIFPMAWHYDAKKLIKRCIDILKPIALDENTCITLNIASHFKCQDLIYSIKDFLRSGGLVFQLLDDKHLCFLLEPESMVVLLNEIEIDSYTLKKIFEWGRNYIKTKSKNADLKSFFQEIKIIDQLNWSCFETIGSFYEFDNSELGKNFFSADDFRRYMEQCSIKPGKSAWINLKTGETFTEKFIVKNVPFLENYTITLFFYRNKVIFYNNLPSKSTVSTCTTNITKLKLHYHYIVKLRDSSLFQQEIVNESRDRETIYNVSEKKVGHSFKINQNKTNLISDMSVEIKITANTDCRVLKSSSEVFQPVEANSENLYFIQSVEIKHEKTVSSNSIFGLTSHEKIPDPKPFANFGIMFNNVKK